MQKYTFEMLPSLMAEIVSRLERIENLVLSGKVPESLDDYLSAKDAAAFLKFTLPTLYTKVCKGEIPSFKQGNRLYFSRVELTDWIESGKKETLENIESSAHKIASEMSKKSRF